MYKIDKAAAIEADSQTGQLSQSGKYIGKFTQAEYITSERTGAHGIAFTFESAQGGNCQFTIWTMDALKATKYFGYNHLNAIMTCMSVHEIAPQTGTVERYNPNLRAREKVTAQIFPELIGKPIGLLLQRCGYEKRDADIGWRLEYYKAFHPESELTSSEIMQRAQEPKKLAEAIAQLKDKPPPKSKAAPQAQMGIGTPPINPYAAAKNGDMSLERAQALQQQQQQQQQQRQQQQPSGFDDPDDDIPF